MLVADSEPIFRFGAVAALRRAGILAGVVEAEDLPAWCAAGPKAPQGLVLDASLGTGTYALETVAALASANPELAIVVTIGRLRASGLVEVMEAGARALLHRLCTPEELVAAVSAATGGQNWVSSELAGMLRSELLAEAAGDQSGALTARELEVLRAMAGGGTNEAIGAQLGIRANTVRNHVHSVLVKLQAATRTDAVAKAARAGLVDLGL